MLASFASSTMETEDGDAAQLIEEFHRFAI
jgi:hypothetical protein